MKTIYIIIYSTGEYDSYKETVLDTCYTEKEYAIEAKKQFEADYLKPIEDPWEDFQEYYETEEIISWEKSKYQKYGKWRYETNRIADYNHSWITELKLASPL